jgi:hypothetical protein
MKKLGAVVHFAFFVLHFSFYISAVTRRLPRRGLRSIRRNEWNVRSSLDLAVGPLRNLFDQAADDVVGADPFGFGGEAAEDPVPQHRGGQLADVVA